MNSSPNVFKHLYDVRVEQKENAPEKYGTLHAKPFPFLMEVFVLADKAKRSKFYAPNPHKFITAPKVDNAFRLETVTVGQAETSFSYDTY